MKYMVDADEWEIDTYMIIQSFSELLSDLKDVETGARGFVITGKEDFLRPYYDAVNKISPRVLQLKDLVKNDPIQRNRLDSIEILAKEKVNWSTNNIKLRKTKSFDVVSSRIATEKGEIIMDKLRKLISEALSDEYTLLKKRKLSRENYTKRLNTVLVFGDLISFSLILGIFLLLKKENSRRTRYENDLRTHQEHLHELVEKRTNELKESRQHWVTTLSSIGDGVIAIDNDGDITFMNSAAEELTCQKLPEISGKPIGEVIHLISEQFNDSIQESFKKILKEGIVTDFGKGAVLMGKEGIEMPVEGTIAPIKGENNETTGAVIVFRDITERRKTEKTSARLAAIVEYSSNAIFSNTLDGIITSWNSGAQRIYGYTEEEVLGKHISIFLPPGKFEEMNENLLKVRMGESISNFETVRMRKSGEKFPVLLTISPIKDENGTILGSSAIASDITDRKSLEEDLRRRAEELAAVNKELESFSYSVAHDLRNPLAAMRGLSEILSEEYGDRLDDEGRSYLSKVRISASQMNGLIDDMLSLSKVTRQEINRRDLNMSVMANEIIGELREADPDRNVGVVVAEDLHVSADEKLLKLALRNLLGNAWKFTALKQDSRIEFGSFLKEGKTVYFVKDNGAGFDPSKADKLFEPFKRLHSEKEFPGTGIGLPIVERVLRRHGGSIWAESEVGKGATFYFTLG